MSWTVVSTILKNQIIPTSSQFTRHHLCHPQPINHIIPFVFLSSCVSLPIIILKNRTSLCKTTQCDGIKNSRASLHIHGHKLYFLPRNIHLSFDCSAQKTSITGRCPLLSITSLAFQNIKPPTSFFPLHRFLWQIGYTILRSGAIAECLVLHI